MYQEFYTLMNKPNIMSYQMRYSPYAHILFTGDRLLLIERQF